MRGVLLFLGGVLLTVRVAAQQTATVIGAWRLVSFEQPDSNGRIRPVWGAKPLGLVIYQEDGTMAAQLFDERRPPLQAAGERTSSEAAKAAAFVGLSAYYGTYTIDSVGKQVTHHVEGAWNADWIGRDVVRAYRFLDDNHLELRPVRSPTGKTVTSGAVLVWERVRR